MSRLPQFPGLLLALAAMAAFGVSYMVAMSGEPFIAGIGIVATAAICWRVK